MPANVPGGAAIRAGGRRMKARMVDSAEHKALKAKQLLHKQDAKANRKDKKRAEKTGDVKQLLKQQLKGIAIAVAVVVVATAILLLLLKFYGKHLPSPETLASNFVQAVLPYFNLTSAMIVSATLALGGGIFYIFNRWQESQKQTRLKALREQMAKAEEELREERRLARLEAQRHKAERLSAMYAANAEYARMIEEQAAEHERKVKEREEAFRALQEKEMAIARQIARESAAFRAQSEALQEAHMQAEKERSMRKKGLIVPTSRLEVAMGEDDDSDDEAGPQSEKDESDDSDDQDSGDDEGDDSDSASDGHGDQELIPLQLDLNPPVRGTRIEVATSIWWNLSTLQIADVTLQLACLRCSTSCDVTLSGLHEVHNHHSRRCRRCKTIIRVTLRPLLLFESASALAYVDLEEAMVSDVLAIGLQGVCGACQKPSLFPRKATRGVRVEATCFQCHQKMAVEFRTVSTSTFDDTGAPIQLAPGSMGLSKSKSTKAKGAVGFHGNLAGIKEGEALPDMGACKHFRKSYKWLRFSCCGKAFPCPICHELTGCEGAIDGVQATRMICGRCSHEQNYTPKPCEACGFNHVSKSSRSHWQGGAGARDTGNLSRKERKKNQGVSRSGVKKTQSKKAERVGQRSNQNTGK